MHPNLCLKVAKSKIETGELILGFRIIKEVNSIYRFNNRYLSNRRLVLDLILSE